jgi:hypothetical protein
LILASFTSNVHAGVRFASLRAAGDSRFADRRSNAGAQNRSLKKPNAAKLSTGYHKQINSLRL